MNKFRIFMLVFCTLVLNFSIAGAQSKTECVYSLHGICYDCNSKYKIKVGTKENCESKCPNRIYNFKDRTCSLKIGAAKALPSYKDTSIDANFCKTYKVETKDNLGNISYVSKNSGEKKIAKKGVYFIGQNGKCYSCDTKEPVVPNNAEGLSFFSHTYCPNRVVNNHANNTFYSAYKCPKDRPLMDRFMMCWSCNESTPLDLSFNKKNNEICKDKRTMNVKRKKELEPKIIRIKLWGRVKEIKIENKGTTTEEVDSPYSYLK